MSRDFVILILAAFPVVNLLLLVVLLWKQRQLDHTVEYFRKILDARAPIIRKMERALSEAQGSD